MKKVFITIVFSTFLLLCNLITCYADNISLYIDDTPVVTDVNPIAVEGRTFLPVRSIFEMLGAKVEWIQDTSQVVVQSPENRIILSPGSDIAYVNSVPFTLDAVPMVKNQRVLIPIRFVSEKLGYTVLWKQEDSSVRIYTNDITQNKSSVKKIDVYEEPDAVTVTIHTSKAIKPAISYAASPERFIADYNGAVFEFNDGKIAVDTSVVKEVRYAIHDEYARVVIESPIDVKYDISYTENATVIKVMDVNYVPIINSNNKYTVVIDAGHGGSDCGSIGYDDNNVPVLYESERNLAIARKVRDYLIAQGVKVIMTRSADVRLGVDEMSDLTERCRIANDASADIFVSIHNNAFSSSTATGTEILYADKDDKVYKGLTSYQLAQNVLTPLIGATGLYNRGLKDSPMIAVLRLTNMPAILVEVAFITNPSDRAVLTDESKVDAIGSAIAGGIIKSLSQIVK